MGGEDKATEIILEKLWELKSVGVRFIIIGHVKQKEQEDVTTGEKYTTLTTNMSMRDFTAIKTKLHFLGVASIDRGIIKESTGKKDPKTKKEILKGVVTKESRRITFRDDSYSIDSKSRFAEIAPECEFNVDSLIQTLTDAIKAEQSKSSKSFDQAQKEQEKKEALRLKELAKNEAQKKKDDELGSIVAEIVEFIKINKSDIKTIKPILELSKELGYANPTLIDNTEVAKKIVALINK